MYASVFRTLVFQEEWPTPAEEMLPASRKDQTPCYGEELQDISIECKLSRGNTHDVNLSRFVP